ncbi:MAG TPA: hypothetical protein PKA00_00420 [Saprospiraceae bacterium]|nr:hypothetical protein [Saprospiraceae bacterium]HMQ81328.1 hypothetical protein [Saprospiraceae bacterium]
MSRFALVPCLLLCFFSGKAQETVKEVIVPFYTERIKLSYSPELLDFKDPTISEKGLVQFFKTLAGNNYSHLLKSLRQSKNVLQLNDWFYYQLMVNSTEQLLQGKAQNTKELFCWFLMAQSGYDTRLAYFDEEVYLYVYTNDDIFEAPIISDAGKQFVNLSRIFDSTAFQKALYLLNFTPNTDGHSFSFAIHDLPALKPKIKEKNLEFSFRQQVHKLSLQVDEGIKDYMFNYPLIAESQYFDAPISKTLAASLEPQLRKILLGKNEWESIEIIASFTRSAFKYQEDKQCFGRSKPMIPDEVFLHPYSDCEDRSVVFYYLVKEMLNLPMIVLAYPDHLTVAVALPQTREGAIFYQGKAYYVCDPTGPVNSSEVGSIPKGYEDQPFEIIKKYK